jgi:hypothetical protein
VIMITTTTTTVNLVSFRRNYWAIVVRFSTGPRNVSSRKRSNCPCDRPSLLFSGKWRVFPCGRAAGCEAGHSYTFSFEVKNQCNSTSTPPFAFMTCCYCCCCCCWWWWWWWWWWC